LGGRVKLSFCGKGGHLLSASCGSLPAVADDLSGCFTLGTLLCKQGWYVNANECMKQRANVSTCELRCCVWIFSFVLDQFCFPRMKCLSDFRGNQSNQTSQISKYEGR
jgi:hypothetical protein